MHEVFFCQSRLDGQCCSRRPLVRYLAVSALSPDHLSVIIICYPSHSQPVLTRLDFCVICYLMIICDLSHRPLLTRMAFCVVCFPMIICDLICQSAIPPSRAPASQPANQPANQPSLHFIRPSSTCVSAQHPGRSAVLQCSTQSLLIGLSLRRMAVTSLFAVKKLLSLLPERNTRAMKRNLGVNLAGATLWVQRSKTV